MTGHALFLLPPHIPYLQPPLPLIPIGNEIFPSPPPPRGIVDLKNPVNPLDVERVILCVKKSMIVFVGSVVKGTGHQLLKCAY